jgi:hypothetical protein
MIRQVVDKSRYNIPVFTDVRLHDLTWYATEDDAVLGVVILDMVDLSYSWIALTQSDQAQPDQARGALAGMAYDR